MAGRAIQAHDHPNGLGDEKGTTMPTSDVRPLYLDTIAPMLREYREMSTELNDALRTLEEALEVPHA